MRAKVRTAVRAEAGTPCRCRRHPSRVAVCISMLPPRCDRLAAWRREGSGVPRTFPQTRTARRQSLEHLHRKRLPQTNRLLPPPYYSAALLMLAPLSGPPLVPATLAIAARPAPSPSPPWQTCARGERRDAGGIFRFHVAVPRGGAPLGSRRPASDHQGAFLLCSTAAQCPWPQGQRPGVVVLLRRARCPGPSSGGGAPCGYLEVGRDETRVRAPPEGSTGKVRPTALGRCRHQKCF